MSQSPYIAERQVEYWSSRSIEDYFLDAGYEVRTFPITQQSEKKFPSDFLFFDPTHSKLFGLQYKALYGNGSDSWYLDEDQHKTLAEFPWMYYALSDLKDAKDLRVARDELRIVSPGFSFMDRLSVRGLREAGSFRRWGGFYQAVRKCYAGVLISSEQDLFSALQGSTSRILPREIRENAVDVFLADSELRKVAHGSPFLSPSRDSAQ